MRESRNPSQRWTSKNLCALSPPVHIASPYITTTSASVPETETTTVDDLDNAEELALQSLLFGIVHRTLGSYPAARSFLEDAHRRQPTIKVSTWIGGLALFELTVLDLKECTRESGDASRWEMVLRGANEKLDGAFLLLSGNADCRGGWIVGLRC
jgi:hypothetical protein